MTETFVIAFTTFFATIGPVDVAAMFAALTTDASAQVRRTIATGDTPPEKRTPSSGDCGYVLLELVG